MLETIRELTPEQLDATGEADAIRRRHAELMLAIVRAAHLSEDDDDPFDHAVALLEQDDIRAALDWAVGCGMRLRPRSPIPVRLGRVVEEVGALADRRGAVDEHNELLVSRVAQLEDRPGPHDEDAPAFEDVALGRLAEIDRERAVEDDEDLLLHLVGVASAARAGRIAPDVPARLGHRLREARDLAAAVVPARLPRELGRAEDRERHDVSIPQAYDRPAMPASVVGREAELAAINDFLAGIRDGASALVLEGEAGMGKTTLWRAAVAEAADKGLRTLEAAPAVSEGDLSFAGLGDLLDAVLEEALRPLPAAQRSALARALVLDDVDGSPPDAHAVGVALLAVLRSLAASGPLLVAVDDVQWLDSASAGALAYAGRRLRGEPVGILLARRTGLVSGTADELRRSLGDRALTLGVGPLDAAALHLVVSERLGSMLPRPLLAEVQQASGGNPFYAIEIVRTLQRRGAQVEAGRPLPVPESLHDLVDERLAMLPDESLRFLLAVAAHAHPTVAITEAASGVPQASGLEPALAAGIVELDGPRIRFTHPLLAAGAYETADPVRRRAVHIRLAELLTDPEARAWQLAASADEPDEHVASVLDEAAQHARMRGALRPAALLLDRAQELTPTEDADGALRRGIDAAFLHFESGDAARAESKLERLIASLPAGQPRARVLWLLARIRTYEAPAASADLFLEVVDQAAGDSALLAAAHEGVASSLYYAYERLGESTIHAEAALALARELDDRVLEGDIVVSKLGVEALTGDVRAAATAELAQELQRDAAGRRILDQPILAVAEWWTLTDRHETATETLADLLHEADESGDESARPYLLFFLSRAVSALGELHRALDLAREGTAAAEQSGQPLLASYNLASEAVIQAELGREDDARLTSGMLLDARIESRLVSLLASSARGHVHLARGAADDVAAALGPTLAFVRREGIVEPAATRFVVDLIEALVELGRREEAVEALEWYEGNARRLERVSALANCARCRGLLAAQTGDLDAALAAFADAVEWHAKVELPLDRGRTLLALGAAQRRLKRRREARATLEEALAVFERIGAVLWAERARAELKRISGRAATPGALTPAEERVAALVGEGKTNKEVAAALFLSDRTVEGHLSRVFAKLGVRHRAEVGQALAVRRR
jgi:DNA-binding CsgD family transcriptional regulator